MEEGSNSNQARVSRRKYNDVVENPQRVGHPFVIGVASIVTIGTSATTGYLVAGYIGAIAGAVMGAFIGRCGGNAVVELIEHDPRNSNVADSKTIPQNAESHLRRRKVY